MKSTEERLLAAAKAIRTEVKHAQLPCASTALSNYVRLRDGGICVYCKDAIGQCVDHVLPRSHGGRNLKENVVLACHSCNTRKRRSFEVGFLTIAFRHLVLVGESLEWIENVFVPEDEDPSLYTLCATCGSASYGYEFCEACEPTTLPDDDGEEE